MQVKPSAQAMSHRPDEPVTDRRVLPHQFVCNGSYPPTFLVCAIDSQDAPSLAWEKLFDHAAQNPHVCTEEKSAIWKPCYTVIANLRV